MILCNMGFLNVFVVNTYCAPRWEQGGMWDHELLTCHREHTLTRSNSLNLFIEHLKMKICLAANDTHTHLKRWTAWINQYSKHITLISMHTQYFLFHDDVLRLSKLCYYPVELLPPSNCEMKRSFMNKLLWYVNNMMVLHRAIYHNISWKFKWHFTWIMSIRVTI